MKSMTLLRIFALIISVMMFCLCLSSCGGEELEFVPPPFDSSAVVGSPDIEDPDAIGYTELDAKAYKVAVCGLVKLSGDSADIYFANLETNEVWLKLRIIDEKGNILGETGLIKPGEYVRSITFTEKVPKVGTKITMKIMGYQPDTYYSAGEVKINTQVS
ncbi:MAG: hypothetical protein IKB02_01435 [Clostridia bacterium]|nr:hypothetical protein [Clostridia bacterium]